SAAGAMRRRRPFAIQSTPIERSRSAPWALPRSSARGFSVMSKRPNSQSAFLERLLDVHPQATYSEADEIWLDSGGDSTLSPVLFYQALHRRKKRRGTKRKTAKRSSSRTRTPTAKA